MNSSPIKQSSSSFLFVLELSMTFLMLLMVVLELSMMLLVASIDSVPAQIFPKKQIHVDPEDCSTIAELLPLSNKQSRQSNQKQGNKRTNTKTTICPRSQLL